MEGDVEYETLQALIYREVRKPLVWARLSSGYVIQDLQPKRFNLALNFLEEYFLYDEVLCRASHLLQDRSSVTGYMERIKYWLGDQVSLECLVEEPKDLDNPQSEMVTKDKSKNVEPVGIIVCKIVKLAEHTRSYSRIKINATGSALDKVMTLRWYIHQKAQIFERYNIDRYLRIYVLSVHPFHRCQGIGMGLMNCAVQMARLLKIPYLAGLFTDGKSQHMATILGMETIFEVQYAHWLDEDAEDLVFDDPGANNYSAAMMTMPIILDEEEKEEEEDEYYPFTEYQLDIKF